LKQEADGYKARIVAQAQGDAQRFKLLAAEYQKAPQVTRDRLYIDAMQQIYSNVTKVLVDSKQGSNLLYLPLDKIIQQASQAATPAANPAPAASESSANNANNNASADARARDGRTRDRDMR
jgi:membrane protease subunit HflK